MEAGSAHVSEAGQGEQTPRDEDGAPHSMDDVQTGGGTASVSLWSSVLCITCGQVQLCWGMSPLKRLQMHLVPLIRGFRAPARGFRAHSGS